MLLGCRGRFSGCSACQRHLLPKNRPRSCSRSRLGWCRTRADGRWARGGQGAGGLRVTRDRSPGRAPFRDSNMNGVTGYREMRARAAAFVREWAATDPVLILAPVREAADEVAVEACGAALMGVRRAALRELVIELSAAELNRRGLVPVGRFVREALAARVTAEARCAGATWPYLGPARIFRGFRAPSPPPSRNCVSTGCRPTGCAPAANRAPTSPGCVHLRSGTRRAAVADHATRVEVALTHLGRSVLRTPLSCRLISLRARASSGNWSPP